MHAAAYVLDPKFRVGIPEIQRALAELLKGSNTVTTFSAYFISLDSFLTPTELGAVPLN